MVSKGDVVWSRRGGWTWASGGLTRIAAHPYVAPAIVASLAIAASAASIANGFAYDDTTIVLNNPRVHTLDAPWRIFREPYWPPSEPAGLYRPVVILAFALEWAVGGGAAWVFHLANILLYVGLSLAVWWLARHFLEPVAAGVAGALFAVHPVHVEAVGNVVGQAELLASLLCVLAVGFYVHVRQSGVLTARAGVAITVLYALAGLTKEHSLVLPVLLAAAEWLVVRDSRPWRARVRSLAPLLLTMAAIALVLIVVRNTTPGVRAGEYSIAVLARYPRITRPLTFLGAVPTYLRLLYWPAHLSVDYSPPLVRIVTRWEPYVVPGAAIIASTCVAFLAARRGGARGLAMAFGIAWLPITLAIPSGAIVAVGVLLAERTLLLPSVGAMLTVGAATAWVAHVIRAAPRTARVARLTMGTALALACGGLITLGVWRSASRQRVWRDNDSVTAALLADAPQNAGVQWMSGFFALAEGREADGRRDMRNAIRLHPRIEWMEALAAHYISAGDYGDAISLLEWALKMSPDRLHTRRTLVRTLWVSGRYADARDEALRLRRDGAKIRAIVALADSVIDAPFSPDSAKHSARSESSAGNVVERPR
jgi:hypothetical protein